MHRNIVFENNSDHNATAKTTATKTAKLTRSIEKTVIFGRGFSNLKFDRVRDCERGSVPQPQPRAAISYHHALGYSYILISLKAPMKRPPNISPKMHKNLYF